MYDLKYKIKKVLENYQNDFLYDFTLQSNRDQLTEEILDAVRKSVVGRIGLSVLKSKKPKNKFNKKSSQLYLDQKVKK